MVEAKFIRGEDHAFRMIAYGLKVLENLRHLRISGFAAQLCKNFVDFLGQIMAMTLNVLGHACFAASQLHYSVDEYGDLRIIFNLYHTYLVRCCYTVTMRVPIVCNCLIRPVRELSFSLLYLDWQRSYPKNAIVFIFRFRLTISS